MSGAGPSARREARGARTRLLAGLALLLAGLAMVLFGVWQSRWLLLVGLIPLPAAGWLLQRGLERGED